ncbi:MAG: minor capsid protein [Atopobiaceae bacterium]|nr:minor capsid protein [Atopobiaceae bacterium]
MDSASYWSERQRIADAAMERDERLLSERVRRVYERELKDLDRQVADYYKRYGEDNIIAYRHLMETLDQADRDLLIRDCDKFLISHPEMTSIVDVRKSIYKLNRLEGLQASARLRLYSATDEVSGAVTDHLAKQALRGANTAAQAMGFGKSFYKLDPDFIRRFVDTPWTGGARYSQRIWDNADTLAAYVGQDMAKAFARGDSYERIAKALSKRFVDVPQSSLMRLVYTEGTYTSRAAQAEELKREGFDEYTVEVVHDGHTCEECHGVEGKTFRFDDAEPGVNFPPLHPYCRCQIAPAVEDWDAWQQKQEELARQKETENKTKGHRVSAGRRSRIFGEPEEASFIFDGKAIWSGTGTVNDVDMPSKADLIKLLSGSGHTSLHDVALVHTHTTRVGGTFSVEDINVLVEYGLKSNTARETQGEKRQFVLERTRKANIELGRKFVEDYRLFTKVTWDEVSYAYWEEHYKALSIPFYDADTTEAEKMLRELQHKWLMENAQRYGYNYYVK